MVKSGNHLFSPSLDRAGAIFADFEAVTAFLTFTVGVVTAIRGHLANLLEHDAVLWSTRGPILTLACRLKVGITRKAGQLYSFLQA